MDKGSLDCPDEIPSLPDQNRLLLRLSEKALEHGVRVSDTAYLPHSPPLSPSTKHGVTENLR